LQAFLADLGVFDAEPSGLFDSRTAAAVRQWQKELEVAETGVVLAGDLVYVSSLPTRVVLSESVYVGAVLSVGEFLFSAIAEAPVFRAVLEPDQFTAIGDQAIINVSIAGQEWPAIVVSTTVDVQSGRVLAALTRADGRAVCAAECESALEVAPDGAPVALVGQAEVVPVATGPQVPQAAIVTDAGASAYVVGVDGTKIPITVRVAADGQAIVDGVSVGQRVLLSQENQ
jgi:peptidoglycan hydrolase-like protein with peptidoglycan-binding domain